MDGNWPSLFLTRRGVVVTGAAALLSACSDDDETSPARRRRRRDRRRRRGRDKRARREATVLTQEDLDEVAARLSELLDGDDLSQFLHYARPVDQAMWERMWTGLHEVPTTDRAFLLQDADTEWRNRQGGPVVAVVRGVVTYRVEGCDAEPVAHLCDLTVFKSPDGELRLQALGALRDETAAPWLLSEVSAFSGAHVVLVARRSDAAVARRMLDDVDRGAARAMEHVPPPAAISKVCVTLGWPEAQQRLYGGSRREFIGSAHDYRYVDPQELADTGRRGSGTGYNGARVVVDPAAASAQGAEAVTAHETVHALAFQWGRSAPPLYAEGLARYVELGVDRIMRDARRLDPGRYRAFARRVTARPGRAAFYAPAWQETSYAGAATTCAYVADRHGEAALRDLVRAAYEGAADPARRVLGMSQEALLREVAAWLEDQQERGRSGAERSPTGADES